MTKNQFMSKLRIKLSRLPKTEVEERISFYSEMIEDRMEAGLSEKDAVMDVGSVDSIAMQIREELKATDQSNKEKKAKDGWKIALIILGSPIWISLIAAAAAIVISLIATLWSVVISLWAVFSSLVGVTFCGIVAGIYLTARVSLYTGIAFILAGVVSLGLSILFFYASKGLTQASAICTKKIFTAIFTKRGNK